MSLERYIHLTLLRGRCLLDDNTCIHTYREYFDFHERDTCQARCDLYHVFLQELCHKGKNDIQVFNSKFRTDYCDYLLRKDV